MTKTNRYSLAEVARLLDARLVGDPDFSVCGLADLRDAQPNQISFLANIKFQDYLLATKAGAIILKEGFQSDFAGNTLFVPNPYLAYARLSQYFSRRPRQHSGVHPSAVVEAGAIIADSAAIGANCFVGADAEIGEGSELYAGVCVGARVKIGRDCVLHHNVVLYHDVVLGDEVSIHANTTIGSDGFGYAPTPDHWQKIHQLGTVVVGDRVEIGANCSIDRGALGNTQIEDDVIIDNQVHIAHNVKIGRCSAIAGCVGIAGSTTIGEHCQVAGMVAINGHIEIADHTVFHGGTVVTHGNRESGTFASTPPLQELTKWRKNSVRYRQLDDLFQRVKALEKKNSD